MKGTLQNFIQNLLEVIFSTSASASTITPGSCITVPPCVKYMFDFMDEQVSLEHSYQTFFPSWFVFFIVGARILTNHSV